MERHGIGTNDTQRNQQELSIGTKSMNLWRRFYISTSLQRLLTGESSSSVAEILVIYTKSLFIYWFLCSSYWIKDIINPIPIWYIHCYFYSFFHQNWVLVVRNCIPTIWFLSRKKFCTKFFFLIHLYCRVVLYVTHNICLNVKIH